MTRRTRSQLSVPDLVLRLPLSRSPLKDARKARRTSEDIPGALEGMDTRTDAIARDDSDHGPRMSTKKRPSPDSDPVRLLSSSGSNRHLKRAKVDAFQFLRHSQDHSEPDVSTLGYRRASSTKPTPSPAKAASIFPSRAQSVPLGAENEVRSIDFTAIPPSPRRSPSRGAVAVWRALSVPPPDEERMDVDVNDTSALLQFTNPTCIATPRANTAFCYAVNFATPRGSATPLRSAFPLTSPASPLTPLPPSPPPDRFREMQSLLAKKVDAKLRDNMTHHPESPVVPSMADGNAMELISPLTVSKTENAVTAVTAIGELGHAAGDASSINSDRAATSSSVHLSSPPRPSDSSAMPISVGATCHERRPSVPRGPKLTRSVSMKERRVEGERTGIKNVTVEREATTTAVAGPSTDVAPIPQPSTAISQAQPPRSVNSVISKSGPTLATRRSASASKLAHDSKLKQTSLKTFVKAKPSAAGGDSTTGGSSAFTSTAISTSSRPIASPSKIHLSALPSKRTTMPQPGNAKPPHFSQGSTSTGMSTGVPRGTSGRSLSTLSNALDKLVVPPPSRPNTSMGFVNANGTSEEDSSPGNSKGKRKAKDDTSLPLASTSQSSGTFARPTASSLKRAATATEFGSTAASRMRGRGGITARGFGRGRRTIGIFNRAGERASKETSLPVVVGSPVKGSGVTDDLDRDGRADKHRLRLSLGGTKDVSLVIGEEDVFASQELAVGDVPEQDAVMQDVSTKSSTGLGESSQRPSPPAAVPNTSNGIDIDLTISPMFANKGKQRAMPPSALNPASSALHALSESLSTLPQTPTPPKPRVAGTRTGLRSSTAAAYKDSPVVDDSGTAATGNHEVHGSGGAGPSNAMVNGSGGVKKSSLKILKRCVIFVDVRTEQGDDAGSLFVDMLKGLGARIMGRLGQRCTHIVYKNGHPNTLMRYRMLDDPKPCVVGITWVVECAEKRAKVDEERFKINVDLINVAGSNPKRRRSMFPKHLIPTSPGPNYEVPLQVSSEVDEDEDGAGGINMSPSQDPDTSIRSREEDDLPPLERVRRRRSILPDGQTRLIP